VGSAKQVMRFPPDSGKGRAYLAQAVHKVGKPVSCLHAESTWVVSPFYKGESQEKRLVLRLEEAGMFAFSPADVMLGGSGFFFL